MFDNIWSSMTSSAALAAECAKEMGEDSPNANQTYEGLERFAQTIESSMIKFKSGYTF